ncbi:MAG: Carboxymuconolactone decarboxylase [Subtercola sp.]|nr:Carboxymuconolactone decarboxylase [Subtercola sp.]
MTYLQRHIRAVDELYELDPEFVAASEALFGHPHRHSVLAPKVRSLVVLAIETVIPIGDDTRVGLAVRQAVDDGASVNELLCVLEISCSIGLHTISVGLPILLEEMQKLGLELPPDDDERRRELRRYIETEGPRPRPLNSIYAAILQIDPEYFKARIDFIDLPWTRAGVLDHEVKHLLSIAIDAVSPQHYADGLRKHTHDALAIGVQPAAILEVLELASVTGLRSFDATVPILTTLSSGQPTSEGSKHERLS